MRASSLGKRADLAVQLAARQLRARPSGSGVTVRRMVVRSTAPSRGGAEIMVRLLLWWRPQLPGDSSHGGAGRWETRPSGSGAQSLSSSALAPDCSRLSTNHQVSGPTLPVVAPSCSRPLQQWCTRLARLWRKIVQSQPRLPWWRCLDPATLPIEASGPGAKSGSPAPVMAS
jgi:hypothetical protein